MADCIEREAAVNLAKKYGLADGSVLGRHTGLADCIASEIASLPAADVAPVVRCKDCAHSGTTENGRRYCKEPLGMYGSVPVNDDDFCSHGTAIGCDK